MKKKLFFLGLFLCSVLFVNAQQKNAIGLRIPVNSFYGAEVSFQHFLNDNSRIEVNLGGMGVYDGVFLSGNYQRVYDLSQLAQGFAWFFGAGAGTGYVWQTFFLGIEAKAGIEYNFKFPLQLSLDYCPRLFFLPSVYGNYELGQLGLAARYRF